MEKRKSPLETKKSYDHAFSKRVNPLTLDKKQKEKTQEANKVDTLKVVDIDKQSILKRKLVLSFIGKDLVLAIKELNPDKKFGLILENLILKEIKSLDLEKYEEIIKNIARKETEA